MSQDDPFSKRQLLERAIAAQEGLRGTLDDAIIDATIAALRQQLAELSPAPARAEQQRKLVTVLFADVVGSTALLRELDPEENMAIMDSALQQLAAPVEAHGGRVTRFMGDGFLAVFGLPRASENDPEMAIRAGLRIVEIARSIAQKLDKERQLHGFQVRVGINTGLVVAGGITEAEGTIMGAAVNLAARLESSAPPGEILISRHTQQHVRGIFDFEPGEPIRVKGFTEPIPVYTVKTAKPRAFRMMTRGVEGVITRMVGRDEELRQLQEFLEIVVQRQESRFVTVVGEAGLGKSRLLDEFESWLDLQPTTVALFKGRATLETLELPYALFRDLFASQFEILDDDLVTTVRSKVVDGFRDALGEDTSLEMKAHFVGQLLGYDFRDSPYLQGVLDAPQQLRDRALVYVTDYFKALAAHHPVALFLDDIHWADESSLEILLDLSHKLSDQQILFVALTRPTLFERRSSWGDDVNHQRLALRPLSRKESERLVGAVLQKVQELPETLRDLIISNAEGNPFYLEELIKMLVEDGVIVKSEPAWRVHSDRFVEERVPPTLAGVIQARLDGLPAKERTVLQQASVIGRVFWDAAVYYINQDIPAEGSRLKLEASDTARNLNNLQQRELIFQRETTAFSDAAEYLFKHAILRDVTYESVLIRTRKIYHALVADWLIAHSGERAGEVTGLIARHLENAGRHDEALEYLCRAAAAAQANYAIDEAAEFYTRALALTPEDDLERQYTLLLGREKVFAARGNRVAQREALTSLEVIADALADDQKRVEVLLRRAWYAFWVSEFPEMQTAAQRAANLAQAIADPGLAGQAYYALAWAFLQSGDSKRAVVDAREALPLARQANDRRGEGNILNILGTIGIAQGDYFAAKGDLEGFLTIARELGDLERESIALNNLGVAHTCLGDQAAAKTYFQRMLDIAVEMGDRVLESTALVNLAWVASTEGDWQSAKEYAEAGVAMKREYEHIEGVAEGLVWLGHAWLGLGQPGKAISAYGESLTLRRELDQPNLAMAVLAGTAQAALAQEDLPTALEHVDEIMTYLNQGGTLQGSWEPLRIYLTCFEILDAVNDPRAGEILKKAFTILQKQASRIPNEVDRTRFLENVPWHREIVKEWEARQALE
jgi:predicted ATPase/class 3 adenylate cyclase